MNVQAIKTERLSPGAPPLSEVLDKHLNDVAENSVIAVTSKIVAICEGRTVPISDKVNKKELVISEADYYLPSYLSKYDFTFTITHNTLIPLAGIDESNGDGHYVLWPAEPQSSANEIRAYLKKRFGLKNVGVIITDSTARPLHYGTEGVGIGYSGFAPSNDYVGKPDLFGRPMQVSVSNILDALASAAVAVMGEGTEQTPLALLTDLPFVEFQDREPNPKELSQFFISHMDDDLFEPFLKNPKWEKGDRQK
ncbi:MAG: putative folate metabolism gamma-glutamate ligase [Candidatus Saccharibacteria bacterium]|nr:putative folate metabolism gamma-glutamate ligase [Candidatus Saccharibacteria bacterium]